MKNSLNKNQNGSIIGLALLIVLIAIGCIIYTNVVSSDSQNADQDSSVIDQARDSVDRVNDAQQRASDAFGN